MIVYSVRSVLEDMDNGKREFTSLTLVEEDLFETGESTDGESEDLDELIFKAGERYLSC